MLIINKKYISSLYSLYIFEKNIHNKKNLFYHKVDLFVHENCYYPKLL